MDIIEKEDLYSDAGVRKISFWAENDSGNVGFFTSFRSVHDFRNQIQSPIVMPLVCLSTAAKLTFTAIENLILTALNLGTFDFKQAGEKLKECVEATFIALYFVASAIIDCAYSLAALATRSIATLFSGVGATINAVTDVFRPTLEAVSESVTHRI